MAYTFNIPFTAMADGHANSWQNHYQGQNRVDQSKADKRISRLHNGLIAMNASIMIKTTKTITY